MGVEVTTSVQMRFSDIDSFGHVNNLAQQAYFDLGKVELFDRVLCKVDTTSAMLVSLSTDFMQQIRWNDQIEVVTRVESIGNKSLTLQQEIRRGEEICARCRSVMVAFDKRLGEAVRVPDEWRRICGA